MDFKKSHSSAELQEIANYAAAPRDCEQIVDFGLEDQLRHRVNDQTSDRQCLMTSKSA